MAADRSDATIERIKLYGGLGLALLTGGFSAAMYLSTHYANASEVDTLKRTTSEQAAKQSEQAAKLSEHDALIRDIHEDVRYIRRRVDDALARPTR